MLPISASIVDSETPFSAIVKKLAERAGLDAKKYGGYPLTI